MMEILGKDEDYIVRKEDIISIEHYSTRESYVDVKTICQRIKIDENEYQRLKRILCKDSDKNE